MPSRAYTSFLLQCFNSSKSRSECVNALSGLYLISTGKDNIKGAFADWVSMPSRAYTSFLLNWRYDRGAVILRASVNALSGLYLISTIDVVITGESEHAAVSMPSRAYTSFLQPGKDDYVIRKFVSMPSRAYTSFLP